MPIRVSLFGLVPFASRWGISVAAKQGKGSCQQFVSTGGGGLAGQSVSSHCQGQRLCLKAFLMNAIEAARLAF